LSNTMPVFQYTSSNRIKFYLPSEAFYYFVLLLIKVIQ
jgi:hypothetical protein